MQYVLFSNQNSIPSKNSSNNIFYKADYKFNLVISEMLAFIRYYFYFCVVSYKLISIET